MRLRLALGGLALLASVQACGKKGSAPPVKATASLADSAEQVMVNIRTSLTDRGVLRGELSADSAYVFDEGTRYELRKVRTTFNTATGVKNGTMSADRGRYNLRQQLLEGFGNVVVTTTEGKRLTSPQLRYSQATNEVASDTSFTMVEPGRTVSGIGFRADPQLNHLTILRGTTGRSTFTVPGQ